MNKKVMTCQVMLVFSKGPLFQFSGSASPVGPRLGWVAEQSAHVAAMLTSHIQHAR